jgi:DNA-binding Xre family transcriptional regulator
MTQHKHVGSSLDDLLESDGALEQVEAEALKRVIVWQVQQAMQHVGVNKTQLAQRMHTSRTVVNRLLDDKDTGGTMTTLIKAGLALGMSWTLQADSDSERATHCVGKTGTDSFSAIEAVLICPCLVLSL